MSDLEIQEPQPQNEELTKECEELVFLGKNLFLPNRGSSTNEFLDGFKLRIKCKIQEEYKHVQNKKETEEEKKGGPSGQGFGKEVEDITSDIQTISLMKTAKAADTIIKTEKPPAEPKSTIETIIEELPQAEAERLSKIPKKFLNLTKKPEEIAASGAQIVPYEPTRLGTVALNKIKKLIKPTWHPPWKVMRVISGHQGWVRCIDVDVSNQFFVTGSTDRTIKFWDLASGQLKLTLTGHINTVRGVCLSSRHAYLYSCGEDKTVKCWDLEYNKVIRSYHGHLSGVYSLTHHPKLDIVASGGRDSVVRVWDIRTKAQIHAMGGHHQVVAALISQEFEPQIISGSHDTQVKLWDLGTGRAIQTLTNHKKAVRSLAFHHEEYTFASGGADNIKVWKCPDGEFLRNVSGHNTILNAIAVNKDNVLVSCGDNGSMYCWDWKSGYNFQQIHSKVQPGSISSEAGIFAAKFDQSSTRLITGECDKTIKIWKEDETATEATHPIDLTWRYEPEKHRY